jgi:hypothetical protein
MTHALVNVLVPYSRFLECQHLRRRIAAELTWRDRPPPIAVAVMLEPADVADMDDSTSEHLDVVVRAIQAALTSKSTSKADRRSPRSLPFSRTSS